MNHDSTQQEVLTVNRFEEGIGFVESLIAIAIAGIACVALLNVATMVMKESKNNEYRDAMNTYAQEGFEKVRSLSINDLNTVTKIATSCATKTGYLSSNGSSITCIPSTGQRCSEKGKTGTCEKLPMPDKPEGIMMFYREIDVKTATGSTSRARVTVRVGMFPQPDGEGNVRNFETNVRFVGYVAQ